MSQVANVEYGVLLRDARRRRLWHLFDNRLQRPSCTVKSTHVFTGVLGVALILECSDKETQIVHERIGFFCRAQSASFSAGMWTHILAKVH